MKLLRQISSSAAFIALICFFLPWVQVSCAGAKDSLTGIDLARNGHGTLWFVPVLMGALLIFAIIRLRQRLNWGLALANMLCGLLSAYQMNAERVRVHDESGLISAQLTGWFWLGFLAVIAVTIVGIAMLLSRERAP
jgi:surface polysaccharide O-acyltransferase-like enzyme